MVLVQGMEATMGVGTMVQLPAVEVIMATEMMVRPQQVVEPAPATMVQPHPAAV
ncbi:hypothetical protein Lery_1161 [Legionella erythra]|uniref:Uncharacterized protein n=1 Tax=Legionella erythra TaxID=448 RepID=A0A0W0TRL4_LEGER|nr:hypothetical protein Lery_1161 [Legionella erythra]